MEPKSKKFELATPFSSLRIIGIIFFVVILSLGIWYARNRQAQNIVSGVMSLPSDILKNDSGRTNVILLGMGGEGHEGGDLTDSILFVSFNLNNNTADIIPIPRDIWIPSMQAKINTAYHYGNLNLAKSAVSEILGVPVHYSITLDFQGFVKAIDAVGGVDVEIDRTFDDYEYPIPGQENAFPLESRYEHVHFDAGITHMDGDTALRFARSRHAVGEEGTDFARGQRQEKIIFAFRNKVLSTSTIFNSETISKLKGSVVSSINTDIDEKEQGSFVKVFLGLGNKSNINSLGISDLLVNPKNTKEYGGQWVLIPAVSWEEVHAYVAKALQL